MRKNQNHRARAFGFWLLAFGFWLLAFGFWLWKWAYKSGLHSFAMVALNQLFAFTATYFLTGQKVGKNPRSHHPAPALRSGVPSLRRPPGPRGLRLAAQVYISRLRLRRRGAAHPGPPDACVRPPEVALSVAWTIARLEAKAKARARARASIASV